MLACCEIYSQQADDIHAFGMIEMRQFKSCQQNGKKHLFIAFSQKAYGTPLSEFVDIGRLDPIGGAKSYNIVDFLSISTALKSLFVEKTVSSGGMVRFFETFDAL